MISFPLFSKLPGELHLQIWSHAVPAVAEGASFQTGILRVIINDDLSKCLWNFTARRRLPFLPFGWRYRFGRGAQGE